MKSKEKKETEIKFEEQVALLPEDENEDKKAPQLVYVSVDKLHPHQDNPRRDLGDLSELAESIKVKGIMQNLTVVPFKSKTNPKFNGKGNYTVVIGHRRLAAAKLAGLSEVPCIIAEMSENEQISTMLLENIQRSDLTIYEQAQAFQMMFDLGESVESIADKTGFSQTTIRRRMKMTELNQETLKTVSEERQLSIMDFDRLSEIDNIDDRNACLEKIGTSNFEQSVNSMLRQQRIKNNIPKVKEYLKANNFKKLASSSDQYSSKYGRLLNSYFDRWDGVTPLLDSSKYKAGEEVFYWLDERYGEVIFLKAAKKKSKETKKRPQAEIDREKYIKETWCKIRELGETFYELRVAFVQKVLVTAKNTAAVLRGAVYACSLICLRYNSHDSEAFFKMLGSERPGYYVPENIQKFLEILSEKDSKIYVPCIYAAFSDGPEAIYANGVNSEFPVYKKNVELDLIYDWLISLGYEMSDDERQIRDGSHSIFIDKDKK